MLSESKSRVGSFLPIAVVVATLSYLLVRVLNTGDIEWLKDLVGAAGILVVAIAVLFARERPEWVILPVALLYLSLPIAIFSEQTRLIVHYGGLLLFALPVLPRILGSKLLTRGNFALFWIYFGWAAFTIIYSLAPEFSVSRLTGSVIGFAIVAGCVAPVESQTEARQLIFRFTIAVVIMAAVCIVAGVILPHWIIWQTPEDSFSPEYVANMQALGIAITGLDRFRSIFGNANDVGQLMLVTVGLAIVCWPGASNRTRWVLASIAVAMVAAAFEADSRSSFVGIGVGVSVYLVWRDKVRGLAILALAAIVLSGAIMLSGRLTEYIARGNIETLTGRTDMWAFVVQQIKLRPILGYGYEVGGAILLSRYFPIWYGPWDQGPRSSLHNGYLAHAVGVGIPATFLWVYLLVRPWIAIFGREEDPWNLKPLFFLVLLPSLVLNLTEASLEDFTGQVGLLCGLCWALAERYRLYSSEQADAVVRARRAAMPPAAQALLFGAARSISAIDPVQHSPERG
jgi:O-antigen ligase